MESTLDRTYVSFKLNRKVGNDEINIELGKYVLAADRQFELGIMGQIAAAAVADYINNVAPTVVPNPDLGDDGGVGGYWEDVTGVRVDGTGETKRVFIQTNTYRKYGVEVYPDFMAKRGYLWAGFKDSFSPQNWRVLVKENAQGTPKIYALKTPSSIDHD